MSFQMSVTLIAIAFACLVVFGIMTLRKTMSALDQTNQTLAEVRNVVHGLSGEAKGLIHSANEVTRDVKGKMKAVDPLIASAHDVGEVVHDITHSVKKATDVLENSLPHSRGSKHTVNIRPK